MTGLVEAAAAEVGADATGGKGLDSNAVRSELVGEAFAPALCAELRAVVHRVERHRHLATDRGRREDHARLALTEVRDEFLGDPHDAKQVRGDVLDDLLVGRRFERPREPVACVVEEHVDRLLGPGLGDNTHDRVRVRHIELLERDTGELAEGGLLLWGAHCGDDSPALRGEELDGRAAESTGCSSDEDGAHDASYLVLLTRARVLDRTLVPTRW